MGARRKGFHVAVVGARVLLGGPARLATPAEVVAFLRPFAPFLVAVDAPRVAAPPGTRSRPCERDLARSVCRLRYTPSLARMRGNPYYEWILHGFALYRALERAGLEALECFPTAAWTRWAGPRGALSRARWSEGAFRELGLAGLPRRIGQDGRDAVAAAVVAAWHARGRTERFGDIVVPVRR